MTYRLIKGPNNIVGSTFASVQEGNVLTFIDGTVFVIEQIFASPDGQTLIASSKDSHLTFKLE